MDSVKITINNASFDVIEDQPFWKFLNDGNWEPGTFNVLESFLEPDKIFIDIGAWIGPVTLFAAAKGARVIALEPDPLAHQKLLQNIELNPGLKDRIKVLPFAISARLGSSTLYARSQYGASSSSLLKRTRDKLSDQIVETITLEKLLHDLEVKPDQISLIKIDIEGGEFGSLPVLGATFKKMRVPTVLISLHYGHLIEHFYQTAIGIRVISLACMKLEHLLGFSFFNKRLIATAREALKSMDHYPNRYTLEGRHIDIKELKASPWKFSDIVFTYRSGLNV